MKKTQRKNIPINKEVQPNNSHEKKLTIYEKFDKMLDIQMKSLTIEEKKHQLKMEKIRSDRESNRYALEVIQMLEWVLNGITIDEEKTILGSEPFLKPIFTIKEQIRIKDKALNLIEKL